MPKIFDCFTFYNELRLLELRLQLHWDSVDRFVIAEATRTFQGQRKSLFLLDAKERFAPYWHKIEHLIIDDMPETQNSWDREYHQRNALGRGLAAASSSDIVLLSDVDELIRPEVLSDLKTRQLGPRDILCFELDWYAYYLNFKRAEKWLRQSPRGILKGSLSRFQSLREVRGPVTSFTRDFVRACKTNWSFGKFMKRRLVPDAGWHLTWLGGTSAIVDKARAISVHSSMTNSGDDLSETFLKQRGAIEQGQGTDGFSPVALDASYPQIILDNTQQWEDLIFRGGTP
ncbi:hypothetical protein [Sulfitobacter aestuariivivens]|uniref:Uncharacterized protein n=1 Tax=Sulfitobacter aestuariivivens TaxID=2766981 RepID=A0A927HE69_9RHOB|nr:hypothetical protein [Sulfitobacter aestuariivivens]MBD3663039.1 hypothetical protein [Sulfitobacter aestuariivivens]